MSYDFNSSLCTRCGEKCSEPCDLLLEWENLNDRLATESVATSRTVRRLINRDIDAIEDELTGVY